MDLLEGANKPETAILEWKGFLLYVVGGQHPFLGAEAEPGMETHLHPAS